MDDFLDGYELPVEEVPVCGKPGLVAEFARLDREVAEAVATGGLAGAPAEMVEQLRLLEEQIEASVMVIKLRAVGYQAWSDLRTNHPPVEGEDHVVYSKAFELAALVATAVEPEFTLPQAERMREKLPPSEWGRLIGTAWNLNMEATKAPKSLLLFALNRQSESSSATPPDEESLAASPSGDSGEQ